MYYLRRGPNADPEGPYSPEYLARMARDGKLALADTLTDAETGSQRTVESLLGGIPDAQWRAPANKFSPGAAVLLMVGLSVLCFLPTLFSLGRMGRNFRDAGGMMPITRSSADRVDALRTITRAAEMYCYQYDGFFPSGMDSELWKEQLRPYLPSRSVLEVGPYETLGANPNLNNIRQGSIIDPYRTLMFYVIPNSHQGEAAASNVDGRVGVVRADELQKSIESGIYNIPD